MDPGALLVPVRPGASFWDYNRHATDADANAHDAMGHIRV